MKSIVLSALAMSFISMSSAFALPSESFSDSAFNEAAKSGKPFLVAFHSDSCGSCKVQKPNLESALQEPALQEVKGLMANFEATSDFRKHLKKPVRGPSTIVIFKGEKEIARIQGETKKEKLVEIISNSVTL